MATKNIKFLCFGRFVDRSLLGYYASEKGLEASFKNEATNLMTKLRLLNMSPHERQKCNTQNGAWFCSVDSNGLAYLVLCSVSYPERHAYGLINETQEELMKIPEYQDASEELLSKHSRRFLPSLFRKYDDLTNIDNIYEAQVKVDQVKNIMSDNVKQLIENLNTMEGMDQKASMMNEQAHVFADDSTKLARIMRIRAIKLKVMVFLSLLAIVLYIVIPIVATNND